MSKSYYKDQILTYMGNKRKFIEKLESIIRYIEAIDKKPEKSLVIAEGFSGSGKIGRAHV